ncbi:hypothetical protein SH449x_002415 [Pirellulaceae bacterium SH449]
MVGRLGRLIPGRLPPEPGLGFGRVLGKGAGSGVGRPWPSDGGLVPVGGLVTDGGSVPGDGRVPGFGRVPGVGRTSGRGRLPGFGRVCPPSDGRVPGLVDGVDGAGIVGLTSAGGRVIGQVLAGGKLGRVDGLVTCGGFTSGREVFPPPRFGRLGRRLPGSPIPIDGLLFPSEGIEGRVGNVEGLLGAIEGRDEP